MKFPFKKGDVLMPKGRTYPDGAVEVSEMLADSFRAFPLGGGFGYRFDAEAMAKYEFHVVTEEETKTRWKRSWFSLDFPDRTYEGFHTGHRWNGWAMPYFRRDAIRQIVKDISGGFIHFDEATGVLAIMNEGETEKISPTQHPELGEVWTFNGWCWNHDEHGSETCPVCKNTIAIIPAEPGRTCNDCVDQQKETR